MSASIETCIGTECPRYDECFVTRMRQRAAEADLVVVNHHLLCADAAVRQLYSHHARALHGYVEHFCPDGASSDDIVQETFIRAWHHLPQLSADDRPVRPWLFRVARNLLIDANRAAQARPMTVPGEAAAEVGTDSGMEEILDRELVSAALQHLSTAHQTVLVETFYRGGTLATVARELGIPHGTARSRLHYALDAMRKQLEKHDAIAAS